MLRVDDYEDANFCQLCGSVSSVFVGMSIPMDLEILSSDYHVINEMPSMMYCFVCTVCAYGIGDGRISGHFVFDEFETSSN